ncbi:MAG: acyl-CoA thioesterase [Roseicyclus sp.]
MYPFLRLAAIVASERRKPAIGILDTHHVSLRCMPWDLDGYLEMNNGRILTLYDLGRAGLALRTGFGDVLRRETWGLVVAGSSVRYRARITALQRFEMRSRMLGWDARFFYLEQAMWRGETCCNHLLIRAGVTRKGRLVPTADEARAMNVQDPSPDLPSWAQRWIEADAHRPWPPAI